MKRLPRILLAAALLLAGCSGGQESSSLLYAAPAGSGTGFADQSSPTHANPDITADSAGVIDIKEKLFIAQTNDIYINGADYLGKTIRYQGIYANSTDWDDQSDTVIHYVIRYGPGCCGYDGEAGFEVRWDGEWPPADSWVEVEGTLCEDVFDSGMKVLYLDLDALTVMEERGEEFVTT